MLDLYSFYLVSLGINDETKFNKRKGKSYDK